jgi:hypothetical protein
MLQPSRTACIAALAVVLCFAPACLAAATTTATVTVTPDIVGTGPLYLGYNQGHFMPGSNTAAWVKRAGINCFRIWASPSFYEPSDDLAPWGDGVTSLASFNARKAALRANPENTSYINWPVWNNLFENAVQTGRNKCTLNYMLGALKSQGIQVQAVLGRTGWTQPGTWADRWEHWQCYYAMAYHMAKNYDVALYETFNEPDLTDGPEQSEYVEWLRFAADAIRCAVVDVNSRFGKQLVPLVLAPTITHIIDSRGNYHLEADPDADPRDDQYGWGQVALNTLRTDYTGTTISSNLFDVFSTHRYNSTGDTYTTELNVLRTRMPMHTPGGVSLPAFYTEFNRYNTSTWFGLDPAISQDTPQVFTDVADILCKTMDEGVLGMICFKFSKTDQSPDGPQRTGYHYVWNEGLYDIGGAEKGVDSVRLFAHAFAGGQRVLQTSLSAGQDGLVAEASLGPGAKAYRLFLVNLSDTYDFSATLDFTALDVAAGTSVTIEEVSAGRQGEVSQILDMPGSKSVVTTQPARSVWLVTVPKGAESRVTALTPVADAQVQGGASANTNFGSDTIMRVKMGSTQDTNRVSYLKFDLGSLPTGIGVDRAVLQVYGRNAGDAQILNFHVYGLISDSWQESTINWNNAPDLASAETKMLNVGADTFPLGNLTVDGIDSYRRMDVTDFVSQQLAGDQVATFALVRELRYSGDTADSGRHAYLQTRESTTPDLRPTLKLWTTGPVPVALSLMQVD